VFYVNVPFGIMAAIGLALFMPRSPVRPELRFDWTGFAVLALAIGSFQLMLDRGQGEDWFTSNEIILAAVLGDQTNYLIGRHVGPRVWSWEQSRFFNKRAFEQAHAFYERWGGITIILARFMPFIRTFAPFVAGVAEMNRARFTSYNVIGALIWVISLTLAGYLFGNLPIVQQHLSKIIWALILVPGLIAIFGAWRARRASL
jgi:membrane protein DedA with SNARE-associated domain